MTGAAGDEPDAGHDTFRIERLAERHDRSGFDSGVLALDTYFRIQVGQDVRRRVASCFVALDRAGLVAGYYTLAAASLVPAELPEDVARDHEEVCGAGDGVGPGTIWLAGASTIEATEACR